MKSPVMIVLFLSFFLPAVANFHAVAAPPPPGDYPPPPDSGLHHPPPPPGARPHQPPPPGEPGYELVADDLPRFIYSPPLGCYVAVGIGEDLVYVNGRYYLLRQNGWYVSPSYRGPWKVASVRKLPAGLRKYRYEQVRSFRDQEYRRYQRDPERYRGRWHSPEDGRREQRQELRQPHLEQREPREVRDQRQGGQREPRHGAPTPGRPQQTQEPVRQPLHMSPQRGSQMQGGVQQPVVQQQNSPKPGNTTSNRLHTPQPQPGHQGRQQGVQQQGGQQQGGQQQGGQQQGGQQQGGQQQGGQQPSWP